MWPWGSRLSDPRLDDYFYIASHNNLNFQSKSVESKLS